MAADVLAVPVSLGAYPPPADPFLTAVWLLESGLWPVVVRHRGKAPLGRGWGIERPTRDSLRAAYRRAPWAGVGLLLGPTGGVIDLEEDDSEAAAPELARLFPHGLPATTGWVSARGRHRLFRWHPTLDGLPSVVSLADGALELRLGRAGKQVMSVCPPTVGVDGGPRRWVSGNTILPLPDRLAMSLQRRFEVRNRFHQTVPGRRFSSVFDRELSRVRSAGPGTRNRTLNRAAFVIGLILGSGRLDRTTAERELYCAAQECGLPALEAARTIERGLNAGEAKAHVGSS